MYYMDKKAFAMVAIILCFCIFFMGKALGDTKKRLSGLLELVYAFSSDDSYEALNPSAQGKGDPPDNIDELLREEYGKSPYSAVKGNIRVSLSQFITEKHYIRYSWVNYDLSSFCLIFYIDDIAFERLEYDAEAYATIEGERGVRRPVYHNLSDYPADDPLGYRMQLFVRFLPEDMPEGAADIRVYYLGDEFLLKNVPLVL